MNILPALAVVPMKVPGDKSRPVMTRCGSLHVFSPLGVQRENQALFRASLLHGHPEPGMMG